MVQENELIALLLCLGASIIGAYNFRRIREIRGTGWLAFSFATFVLSSVFTVLEGFFWETSLNMLEHLCFLVSACLLAVWLWRSLIRLGGEA